LELANPDADPRLAACSPLEDLNHDFATAHAAPEHELRLDTSWLPSQNKQLGYGLSGTNVAPLDQCRLLFKTTATAAAKLSY
jgi:hypothetical protein